MEVEAGCARRESESDMAYPERSYGEKYHAFHRGPNGERVWRKASEYSAQIRKDIKEAVKAGTLPGAPTTYSVTCESYSGGRSVRVVARDLPGAWVEPDSEESGEHYRFTSPGQKVLSKQAVAVQRLLKRMVDAYNYDGSDAMTDYYDVNYYGFAEIESEWSADWRAREKARKAAG